MANKDVFDEKMDALAESINAKAGTSGALTLDGMKSTVDAIELGSNVIANPTLEGGEDDLTSIEIDGTKYAIPSGGGGTIYRHVITCYSSTIGATIILYNKDNTPFTINSLNAWLKTHSIGSGGSITYDKQFYPCAGYLTDLIDTSNKFVTIITFCGIMPNYSYSGRVTILCKNTVIPYADSAMSPSTNNIVTYNMTSIVDTVSEV